MPRRPPVDEIPDAARSTLVEGERIVEYGYCWGAQRTERLPLVLTGRNEYLMVLTDRRLLLFARRSGPVQAKDLILGKRYESFKLQTVHRARPLLQLRVQASNGTRMVFEFRRGRRHVGDALVQRLGRPPVAALPAATAAASAPASPPPPPSADAPAQATGGADVADPTFWGASQRRT